MSSSRHRIEGRVSLMRTCAARVQKTAPILALILVITFVFDARRAGAQLSATDWEKAAGGKMSFEVASIKPSAPDERTGTNVGLDSGNDYEPSGGLFRATHFDTASYISFAYKLTQAQRMALQHEGPKWIHDDRFDLEARAPATATKDQLRLMMQSLLADRFKLAIHMEKREIPMFGLALVKEGKLGPHLRHYADDPPCSLSSGLRGNQHPEDLVGGLPPVCDAWIGTLMPDGHASFGARNVTMQKIADGLPTLPDAELDRPVVDQTGLAGTFDFWLELSGNVFGPLQGRAPAAAQTDDTAPSFVEIIRDQLGLKLVPTTGQVDTPVIDHIEKPTPN